MSFDQLATDRTTDGIDVGGLWPLASLEEDFVEFIEAQDVPF